MNAKRLRFWGVWVLAAVAATLLYLTDPDGGVSTKVFLMTLLSGSLAVGLAHAARKSLFDYAKFDLGETIITAAQSPVGAGLVVLSVSILMIGLLSLFGGLLHG